MGSTWYHLAPSNASLVWDRLPMTLVFAGVLGTAIAQRVGNDAGRLSLALLVPLGIASVAYWKVTGDLSLYAALQLGGVGGLVLLMLLTRKGNDSIPWAWVLGWYALAKVAEFADQTIFEATHHLISGHTLKHLLAAAAGAAVLWPLRLALTCDKKPRRSPLVGPVLQLGRAQRVGEQRRDRHRPDTSRHRRDPRGALRWPPQNRRRRTACRPRPD